MADLLAAHRHASNHRTEIEASTQCGCFHCLAIFAPSEIIAWSGGDPSLLEADPDAGAETALCPHCGSESVIGDRSGYRIDAAFLGRMRDAWHQKTIIRRPAGKK